MYYSAVNCDIILVSNRKETVIEEAYALSFNRTDGVMPYYNWARKKVDRFINGTTLVQGTLILNVNKLNYLQELISGSTVNTATLSLAEIEASLNFAAGILESKIIDEKTVNTGVSIGDLISLAQKRRKFLEYQNEVNITPSLNKNFSYEHTEEELGFKIEGPLDGADEVKDLILGVRFTGKSYEIASDSSMNIKYAFPFVARDSSI